MGEKKVVVDKLQLTYDGLFNVHELLALIRDWFAEHGYDRLERGLLEKVTRTGKYFELELNFTKDFTDYVKSEISVFVTVRNLKDVVVTKDDLKVNMHQGTLEIEFYGFLVTDYSGKWEMNPIYFFLKTIYEKFLYSPVLDRYEKMVVEDVNRANKHIKSYLNLYTYGKPLEDSTGMLTHLT